jgi:hypothetical protein
MYHDETDACDKSHAVHYLKEVLMTTRPRTFRPRLHRRVPVFGVVIVAALIIASVALGGTYYGFNYLAPSSPTGTCYSAWGNGCGQSGFNNWNWSTITKNSGDNIGLGFRSTGGSFYYNIFGSSYNGKTFHVTASGMGAPTYNSGFCGYWSGSSSYVQCSVS